MFIQTRISLVLGTLFAEILLASAQQISPVPQGSPRSLHLSVIVAPKVGRPITDLQKDDFKLLDNKFPQPITSFTAANSAQEPVKVILFIDAVNTNFDRVAYARGEVQKFLRKNGGQLAQPTSIAVLTDTGTNIQKDFSTDGNALSSSLDHYTIGLRQITRASGIWGANERVQISLTAVRQLIAYAEEIPGRKIVLWVSPGWPLLSGNRISLNTKQQQQIFTDVVSFSKQLQQSKITLYNINPLGPEENLFRTDFYQSFLQGVSRSNQTDLADLSLQVLAIQSGGLSLNGSNDVAAGLNRCIADANSWYELTFDEAVSEKADEYHHIEIVIDKQGLTARTRDGYYAQP